MKKEVILVPMYKCPMDVLAEMGERTRDSWIFLHENAYQHLLKSEGASHFTHDNTITLIQWEATEDYPKTSVVCRIPSAEGWGKIDVICAKNIAYHLSPNDPEDIFFLKMKE